LSRTITIHLNDKLGHGPIKVKNEGTNRMLAPKPQFTQLTSQTRKGGAEDIEVLNAELGGGVEDGLAGGGGAANGAGLADTLRADRVARRGSDSAVELVVRQVGRLRQWQRPVKALAISTVVRIAITPGSSRAHSVLIHASIVRALVGWVKPGGASELA
jgi:hypothetical protein